MCIYTINIQGPPVREKPISTVSIWRKTWNKAIRLIHICVRVFSHGPKLLSAGAGSALEQLREYSYRIPYRDYKKLNLNRSGIFASTMINLFRRCFWICAHALQIREHMIDSFYNVLPNFSEEISTKDTWIGYPWTDKPYIYNNNIYTHAHTSKYSVEIKSILLLNIISSFWQSLNNHEQVYTFIYSWT